MNVQEALPFADEVVFAKTGKHLHDMQVGVIEGVLKWQKYGDIAQGLNFTEGDAKDVGSSYGSCSLMLSEKMLIN
jgi:hypothetical protein